MTTWDEVLDEAEHRLADGRRGLTTGRFETPPFFLPAELGPLPAALRPRAVRILEATEELVAELDIARQRVAGALQRARNGSQAPAAYVDTRA